jgi:NAD(P)H-binding
MMRSFLFLLSLLVPLTSGHAAAGHAGISSSSEGDILVLGATGRTGSLLYQNLINNLKDGHHGKVRALVQDRDKAREILQCDKCDESEGVYEGDIRNLTSLLPAFRHVRTVAIATGVSGVGNNMTREYIRAVEFEGVQNAVRALAQVSNLQAYGVTNLRVVLCSSRGTTTPSSMLQGVFGDILFYKLNAEAFLGSIGMVSSIVKPCGLSNNEGHNATLVVLHDDAPVPTGSFIIPRADVARVMAELVMRPPAQNLRFDLCSLHGPATTDLQQLVESAKWSWQHPITGTDTSSSAWDQRHKRRNLQQVVAQTMQSVPTRFIPVK